MWLKEISSQNQNKDRQNQGLASNPNYELHETEK
jgi:hypothetical protein